MSVPAERHWPPDALAAVCDPETGRRIVARVHVNEGTLARSLLSSAIDDADSDADTVVAVFDGIDEEEIRHRQPPTGVPGRGRPPGRPPAT